MNHDASTTTSSKREVSRHGESIIKGLPEGDGLFFFCGCKRAKLIVEGIYLDLTILRVVISCGGGRRHYKILYYRPSSLYIHPIFVENNFIKMHRAMT